MIFQYFRQYLSGTSANHEANDIECDCLQCLPESRNLSQNKRKILERNRMCKQAKKQCVPLPSSSQTNSIEPLPGPSGMSSNFSNVTNPTVDSSDSENEVVTTASNQRMQSDVLTAPELQLDCFSDSSSDSGNDIIQIVSFCLARYLLQFLIIFDLLGYTCGSPIWSQQCL